MFTVFDWKQARPPNKQMRIADAHMTYKPMKSFAEAMTDTHMMCRPVKGFAEDSMPPQQAMADTHMMSGPVKGFAEDSMPPQQAMTDTHMRSGPVKGFAQDSMPPQQAVTDMHMSKPVKGFTEHSMPPQQAMTNAHMTSGPVKGFAEDSMPPQQAGRHAYGVWAERNTLSYWFQAMVQYEQYELRLIRPQSGTTKWALWQGQQQRTELGHRLWELKRENIKQLYSVEVVTPSNAFDRGGLTSRAQTKLSLRTKLVSAVSQLCCGDAQDISVDI
ncbi:hypothetical protein DFH08DRAFT_820259 [Mycena albidolilacea]|uniref:Uncharacterized protein n=1 Tax=Mycena albidolilacea TaxID=1033008 RepID=A0AAD6ZCC7_9AGAR|nr:hypothetical protein DFH08DRAFT_820259 [Mycena albidolilacea]